jgi:hypothetical protein
MWHLHDGTTYLEQMHTGALEIEKFPAGLKKTKIEEIEGEDFWYYSAGKICQEVERWARSEWRSKNPDEGSSQKAEISKAVSSPKGHLPEEEEDEMPCDKVIADEVIRRIRFAKNDPNFIRERIENTVERSKREGSSKGKAKSSYGDEKVSSDGSGGSNQGSDGAMEDFPCRVTLARVMSKYPTTITWLGVIE